MLVSRFSTEDSTPHSTMFHTSHLPTQTRTEPELLLSGQHPQYPARVQPLRTGVLPVATESLSLAIAMGIDACKAGAIHIKFSIYNISNRARLFL